MVYEEKDVLRLAKRSCNTKRSYLLVNPLQGKHIPVSPSAALEMMESLGSRIRSGFPEARLVIGFAETATAIGAAAAGCFDDDCLYIHTTREGFVQAKSRLIFQEEHSHAMEQTLCGDRLQEWISASPQIVLVDDELSTGKTILNMAAQMRRTFPALKRKQIIAASIINRLSDENTARLREAGIVCASLLKIPERDYTQAVQSFQTVSPVDLRGTPCPPGRIEVRTVDFEGAELRLGASIGDYYAACGRVIERIMPLLQTRLGPDKRVLVLGTEEFMYLPLLLAREIERAALAKSAAFHATTRSPIEVCPASDYPIFNGYRMTSFYEAGRDTYIYDLAPYDAAIVLSDSRICGQAAVHELAAALYENGCADLLLLCGGTDV